jgi:23S rRNA pseudouridine2604 synthase
MTTPFPPLRPQPQLKPGTPAKRIINPTPSAPAPSALKKPAVPKPPASAALAVKKQRPSKPAAPPAAVVVEGQRLSKVVMAQAQCSRMEAERLIEAGRVQVDGVVCQDVPRRIQPAQHVDVQGDAPASAVAAATLLLHKPAGINPAQWMQFITSARHTSDHSGLVLLKKHLQHLNCVASLEEAASGLMVLTQHAGVTRLFHDPQELEHELMAEVQGSVSPEQLQKLQQLPQAAPASRSFNAFNDPRPKHIKASISHTTPELTRLRLAIKGYQPGDALALCQAAELHLQHLSRLRIGRVALKTLAQGQWRFLLGYERF